jgi:O-acetyl-ADP-ribose deacetylase (regulator of RNase III)
LASYNAEINKNSEASVITVQAAGQLASKWIYFLPWMADSDASVLQQSIEKFVSDAVEKAVEEGYRSIAFPAIGCGQFGCSINLVAQAMVGEVCRKLQAYNMSISFVIQPERADVYDEFRKQVDIILSQLLQNTMKIMSATVGKGRIEVEQGDITMQKV